MVAQRGSLPLGRDSIRAGTYMRSKIINAGANLALLAFAILLSLLLCELTIRIVFPRYDPSGHVRLERLSDGTPIGPRGAVLRQIKNTGDYDVEVRFNAWGLRDDKPLSQAGERAVFVVGDSFAFGWGVDARDRFSDRLQAILGRPVFNIAMGSGNLDDYGGLVRYAEANGAVVGNLVIAVTMENDIGVYHLAGSTDPIPTAHTLRADVLLRSSIGRLKLRLAERSALYFAFTSAVHGTPWLRRVAVWLKLLTPNLDGVGEMGSSNEALTTSAQRLIQLARGREALVLIIPSRRLWVGDASERENARKVHTAFVDRLLASGIRVVDMRDRFEQGGSPLSYHFVNDGHWNKDGHRLAADALGSALQ